MLDIAARGARFTCAANLDLVYVAAGRLDSYREYNTQPASSLLVKKSGGMVRPNNAGEKAIDSGHVVATLKFHAVVREILLEFPMP